MSNDYFQFKQFRIEQDRCAMKVTTDACIQGAWTPLLPGIKRVLDIGAGTGLLSLMLAQRVADVVIDAIEYDAAAAAQARANVAASPWHDRINIIEADVCGHVFEHKYDLIISNPPFFNNSLLSDKHDKNKARHTVSLSYGSLESVISENLSDEGYASILLPATEYLIWDAMLKENGWHVPGKLSVRHTEQAAIKRVVGLCTKKEWKAKEETLTIKDSNGRYTPDFTALLAPFYLDL